MYFKSIDDLDRDIINNLYKIPKDIDLVVGVPRSGLFVANIIALYLNVPLSEVDGFLKGNIFESGLTRRSENYEQQKNNPKKVLIVEDSVLSGKSLLETKRKIKEQYKEDIEIIYLAAYVIPEKKDMVDIYLDICKAPRVFEWNIMHHRILEKSCFDLDGVLCLDPTKNQDDDGEIYKNFLLNAEPLFIPTQKIGNIVTCRLEKYRNQTEEWLKINGIKYDNLIMMNYESKAERIKQGKHAQYKAEHYKKTKSDLFIESNLNQAIMISKVSKMPVYCIEVRRMIYPNYKVEDYGNVTINIKFKNIIKRLKNGVVTKSKKLFEVS